ncbi:MAG TPA: glycosyltransferase family A protein, partial [Candidatus Limnocylindrales bacterium]|nr:glycosyltransferase family A protein [Candidatus Limnocylindrales bacterium]
MTPRVTVSLVTYNGMHWLWGCVMSVLRQKMGRLELQVVDNGSTDGSLDFLRDAAAHDTRIQVTAL